MTTRIIIRNNDDNNNNNNNNISKVGLSPEVHNFSLRCGVETISGSRPVSYYNFNRGCVRGVTRDGREIISV